MINMSKKALTDSADSLQHQKTNCKRKPPKNILTCNLLCINLYDTSFLLHGPLTVKHSLEIGEGACIT